MRTRLIFGCGYLGRRVADRWLAAGDRVIAVTRDETRAGEFTAAGIEPLLADVTQPESLNDLPAADTVLYSVGYDRQSGKPIEEVYVHRLAHVLARLPDDLGKLIYISSTGVYGSSTEGETVDEETPCEPVTAGGKACRAAEQLLAADPRFAHRRIILRLAGIYGPGRLPRAESLRQGEPLPIPADGLMNLIHVEDAADITDRAAAEVSPPALYVVSDGHPVTRRDYHRELAELLAAPEPNFVEPDPTTPVAQRALSSKRLSNARLLHSLQIKLRYPSYREGLAASLTEE